MGEDLDGGKPWNYQDDPKAMGTIAVVAAILGIVLALALNRGGEPTKVATSGSTSHAPVTAPPLVPEPPVGSTIEPKT